MRMLRIQHWWYLVPAGLLGSFFCDAPLHPYNLLYPLLVTALYLCQGYAINYYFDYKRGESTLSLRPPTFLPPLAIAVCCLLVALTYSIWTGMVALLGIVLGLIYSSNLWRVKQSFLANIAFNSTGLALIAWLGIPNTSCLATPLIYSLFAHLWILIVPHQIIHIISHQKKENGLTSVPRYYACIVYFSISAFAVHALLNAYLEVFDPIVLQLSIFYAIAFTAIFLMRKQDWGRTRLHMRYLIILLGVAIFTSQICKQIHSRQKTISFVNFAQKNYTFINAR